MPSILNTDLGIIIHIGIFIILIRGTLSSDLNLIFTKTLRSNILTSSLIVLSSFLIVSRVLCNFLEYLYFYLLKQIVDTFLH